MYISKKTREVVRLKFGGLCAYSGTVLESDWQVDHLKPLIRGYDGAPRFPERHSIDNMVPSQKIINHYKGTLDPETFRSWYLGGLHERLKKLPRKTRVKNTRNRKRYLRRVASFFDITPDTPFSGIFYYEIHKPQHGTIRGNTRRKIKKISTTN